MQEEVAEAEAKKEYSNVQRFRIRHATQPEMAYRGWEGLKHKGRMNTTPDPSNNT